MEVAANHPGIAHMRLLCWKLLQQSRAPASQETVCSGRVSLDLKGIYTCLALSLHIKLLSPELRSISALESSCWVCAISLSSLCGQCFLQLWTQRQAAHLTNISCHSPPIRSRNGLFGTTGGLCLTKRILPSLVSAIDLFHLILMWFEQVSLPTTFNLLCNSEDLKLKLSAWFFFPGRYATSCY